jgi:hypothetical protein
VGLGKFIDRNRAGLNIVTLLAFGLSAILNGYEYFFEEGKRMDLFALIVFGLLTIFKISDIIEYNKDKRKSGHDTRVTNM